MNDFYRMSIVDIDNLCIPINKCVCIKPGDIKIDILNLLENNDFDFAPVLDSNENYVIGLAERIYLKKLLNENKTLSNKDPNISDEKHFIELGSNITIDYLLEKFLDIDAAIIYSEMDGEKYGSILSVKGLLTISDLNRHPIRSTLYGLISVLESGLAKLIKNYFSDHWDWIAKLNEENQVRIIGYWELSKRKGVDIGPLEAAMLSQLIQIISKTKELMDQLSYRSRTEFDKGAGKIPHIRNCVMHPVRPLILDKKDVKKLYETVIFIQDLIKRINDN